MAMKASEMVGVMLDVFKEQLTAEGRGADLCITSLMPGAQVIIDYVDCGGMAWVRVVDAYNTVAFPRADGGEKNCAIGQMALTMEMGIVRRAPMIEVQNDEPIPPDEADQNAATFQQLDDMECMKNTLTRLAQRDDLRIAMAGYTPTGPDGDALGGTWAYAVTSEEI